jgi:phage terminase large subunit
MPIEDQFIRTFSRFFRTNEDRRILVLYGGAGSGKSYSTAQWIIIKWLTGKNIKILCTRKTLPSLKITSWALVKDILERWEIPHEENRTDFILKFRSNEMLFKSLDDPEKVKSFEANYIWIEEATELTKEDFIQLDLRARKLGGCQLILTFNPIDAFHWTITDLVQRPADNVAVHHSTYKDNRFLPADYVHTLETLNERDPNFYRIYTLGEPGVLSNTIYHNYRVEDPTTWPDRVRLGQPTRLGVDFGFTSPTAVIAYHEHDGERYIQELLYRTHLTNGELIMLLKANIADNRWSRNLEVVCDSAEPDRIQEMCDAGLNAIPAVKDVVFGIDTVRTKRLHIDSGAVNVVKEIRGYSYKTTKDGRVLEEPIQVFDHAMDAIRYAIATTGDPVPRPSRLTKMIVR